jgi:long-chain fatty acid transport protein
MPQLFEDFGVGPRDVGMGNTGTASATDYSAAFYNPAALAYVPGIGLDLGYKLVAPRLTLKLPGYSSHYFTNYPDTNLVVVGGSWNVVLDEVIERKWTDRFTFGVAIALSDFYKSFTVYYDVDTPYFFRYHDRALNLLSIYFSLGVRLTDWVSIGAGLVPAPCDSTTRVLVDSNFTAPEYSYRALQGTATRSYGKLEPVLGLLFNIPAAETSNYVSLGFTWRDEVSSIDGEGHATDRSTLHINGQEINMGATNTPILTLTGWTPMQAIGGVAWRPVTGLTITAEELWKRWSRWKNFFIEHPDPRFHDTWNTRAGVEYVANTGADLLPQVMTRLGGYRELSPVPDQNGQSNYLDPEKWVATAGVDTVWSLEKYDIIRAPMHLGIFAQVHLMDDIHLNNSRDPDYPPLDAGGQVYSFTVTMGFKTQ